MSEIYPDIINDIFFAKEKCAVCGQEFNSIMFEHPKLDQAHIDYSDKIKLERQERESNRKPWYELQDPINRFISKQCPDLEHAKRFVYHWYTGTHKESIEPQLINIGEVDYGGTMRAMAFTVSRVLEGYDDDVINTGITFGYMNTVYGPTLYNAMCRLE